MTVATMIPMGAARLDRAQRVIVELSDLGFGGSAIYTIDIDVVLDEP